MIHTLQQALENLQEIFLAGSASAYQNPHLQRQIDALANASLHIPAVQQLQQTLSCLVEADSCEQATPILLRAQALTTAVLVALASTSQKTPTQAIVADHPIDLTQQLTNNTYQDLQPIQSILMAKNHKKNQIVQEAIAQQRFKDWRSFPVILHLLQQEYRSITDQKQVYEDVIQQAGECFRTYLYQRPIDKESIGHYLHFLIELGDKHAVVWGQAVLSDPELFHYSDNLAVAVEALGGSPLCESQVLGFTQHPQLNVRAAAYSALIRMQSTAVRTLLFEEILRNNHRTEMLQIHALFARVPKSLSPAEENRCVDAILHLWSQVHQQDSLSKKQEQNNRTHLFKIVDILHLLLGTERLALVPILKQVMCNMAYQPLYQGPLALTVSKTILVWFLSSETLAFDHLKPLLADITHDHLLSDLEQILRDPPPSVRSWSDQDIFTLFSTYVQSFDWHSEPHNRLILWIQHLIRQQKIRPWAPYLLELITFDPPHQQQLSFEVLSTVLFWLKKDDPIRADFDQKYLEMIVQEPNLLRLFYHFDPFDYYIFSPQNTPSFLKNQPIFLQCLPTVLQQLVSDLEQLQHIPFSPQAWGLVPDRISFIRYMLSTPTSQPFLTEPSHHTALQAPFYKILQAFARQLIGLEHTIAATAQASPAHRPLQDIRHICRIIFMQS